MIAVMQGYLLYLQESRPNELITRHMWGSIAFVALACLTYMSKVWSLRSETKSPMYGILLTLTIVAMTLAGHWGGESMHGDPLNPLWKAQKEKKEGDESSEEKAEPLAKVNPEDLLAYEQVVVPILKAKCYYCHAEDTKKKGKLLMDSYQGLLDGGSEGPSLVPGDLEESLMIVRIHIPADDDPYEERMPPIEEEEQLTEGEIAILDWWVKIGAPTGKSMSAAGAPEEILEAAGSLDFSSKPKKSEEDESESY